MQKSFVDLNSELNEKEKSFQSDKKEDDKFEKLLAENRGTGYETLRQRRVSDRERIENARNNAYSSLVERRTGYLKAYPNRTFSAVIAAW